MKSQHIEFMTHMHSTVFGNYVLDSSRPLTCWYLYASYSKKKMEGKMNLRDFVNAKIRQTDARTWEHKTFAKTVE